MRRPLCSSLLILIAAIISSCSDEKDMPIGQWDDIIKLSTKKADFNSSADSITIKTGGNWWWIDGFSVDKKRYNDFRGIDILADSYSIKRDSIVIERRDKNTLFIKVGANPNNVERIISVGLEAGNYFDGVTITQKPK